MDNKQILKALLAGKRWADRERTDMLCKAGAYSPALLKAAKESSHWRKVMADCKAIDTAIEALSPST